MAVKAMEEVVGLAIKVSKRLVRHNFVYDTLKQHILTLFSKQDQVQEDHGQVITQEDMAMEVVRLEEEVMLREEVVRMVEVMVEMLLEEVMAKDMPGDNSSLSTSQSCED